MQKAYKEKIKSSKGITLIALVITIVILMVIATVTISITLGENGLIGRTESARVKLEKANVCEILKTESALYYIDKYTMRNTDSIDSYLTSKGYITLISDGKWQINVQNLTGSTQSIGNGTVTNEEFKDVYMLEKTSSNIYEIKYYDKNGNSELLDTLEGGTTTGSTGGEEEPGTGENDPVVDEDLIALRTKYVYSYTHNGNLPPKITVDGDEYYDVADEYGDIKPEYLDYLGWEAALGVNTSEVNNKTVYWFFSETYDSDSCNSYYIKYNNKFFHVTSTDIDILNHYSYNDFITSIDLMQQHPEYGTYYCRISESSEDYIALLSDNKLYEYSREYSDYYTILTEYPEEYSMCIGDGYGFYYFKDPYDVYDISDEFRDEYSNYLENLNHEYGCAFFAVCVEDNNNYVSMGYDTSTYEKLGDNVYWFQDVGMELNSN